MAVTKTTNLWKGNTKNNTEDVKEVQRMLNAAGYKLEVDGSFGGKTAAAVRDYQKKKGLKVDGVVGTNTWSSLVKGYKSNTTTNTTPVKNQTASAEDLYKQSLSNLQNYGDLTYADDTLKAGTQKNNALTAWQNYGDFDFSMKDQYADVMQQKLNRDPFAYDVNADALYQQYKDQYTTQGKLAMQDTMGQAAALTGGYGNSYAQTAGQQTYHNYLQQLNDKVPELYNLALNKYNMEGQELTDKLNLMNQERSNEYNEWLGGYNQLVDGVNIWSAEEANLQNRDANLWEAGLNKANALYTAASDAYNTEWNQNYTLDRDKVEDDLAQKQLKLDERQIQLQEQGQGVTAAQNTKATTAINKILNGDGTEDEKMEAIAEWIEDDGEDYPDWYLENIMETSGYIEWLEAKKTTK